MVFENDFSVTSCIFFDNNEGADVWVVKRFENSQI